MVATAGRGVDVALNSLSDEQLHATRRCVAKWGTMVEIGKRDLLGAGRLDMSLFLDNRSYRCADLDQMRSERPSLVDGLMRRLTHLLHEGLVKPVVSARVVPASGVLGAFRYMQQGTHIGKIVVAIRDQQGALRVDEEGKGGILGRERPLQLDGDGAYLLVGGLGGLGRAVAFWMARQGTGHLVFLGRSAGADLRDQRFVHELASMGCVAQLVRGSVTGFEAVLQAVDAVSPKSLRGIVNMSMVVREQTLFPGMTMEEWNGSIEPKMKGTWDLHNATLVRNIDVDFFVLFSSTSGMFGQIGQANYAAASTYLDAFAQYRTGLGMPCSAIALGAVEDAGYLMERTELLSKMKSSGWLPVREEQLLDALGAVLRRPMMEELRAPSDLGPWVDRNYFLLGMTPFRSLRGPGTPSIVRKDIRLSAYHNLDFGHDSGAESGGGDSELAAFLVRARGNPSLLKSSPTVAFIASETGKRLRALLLQCDQADDVDISMSLSELGLDSMAAVEMRSWWKQTFGSNISVLERLGRGTLEALGRRAVDDVQALLES